jgi:hypothetical protein
MLVHALSWTRIQKSQSSQPHASTGRKTSPCSAHRLRRNSALQWNAFCFRMSICRARQGPGGAMAWLDRGSTTSSDDGRARPQSTLP